MIELEEEKNRKVNIFAPSGLPLLPPKKVCPPYPHTLRILEWQWSFTAGLLLCHSKTPREGDPSSGMSSRQRPDLRRAILRRAPRGAAPPPYIFRPAPSRSGRSKSAPCRRPSRRHRASDSSSAQRGINPRFADETFVLAKARTKRLRRLQINAAALPLLLVML